MRTNYILPLMLLNILAGAGSAITFWLSSWDPIWAGAFLATFPLPFLLIGLSQIFNLARTSARLPVTQILSIGAVVLVSYTLFTRPGPISTLEYVALGIAIFGAIFVQGFEHSKTLAEKLKLPDHYEILQDSHLRAARTLGIEDIGGSPAGMSGYPDDTVMATVIATDEEGRVLFGDETDNYRVRPHPDTFIHVFE